MNDSATSFTCDECGEELPARALSTASLSEARSQTGRRLARGQALLVLDAPVCEGCAEDDEQLEDVADRPFTGRTEGERFEFSGLHIDPARRQAYLLNY